MDHKIDDNEVRKIAGTFEIIQDNPSYDNEESSTSHPKKG